MERTAHNRTALEESHRQHSRWLTTFNDMITLLMVFFVLLFAMGSMDVKRFHHFQNALQSAMGVLHSGKHAPIGELSDDSVMPCPALNASRPMEKGDNDLSRLEDTQGLEAEYTRRGIQLTLKDELLFESGSARLTARGLDLLDKVARIIGPLDRLIRVEGHTDNVPISTLDYPSNWELSTARAISVVKYLHQKGNIPPRNLSAAGYGASRPRALNDSQLGRSKNRRVEIILQQQAPSQLKQ
jgi:chemotaxis protein MotB